MKTETKFTKGEWLTKEGQIYCQETGRTLALIPYFDNEEKQIADAQLIAAAPDMLEALDNFIRAIDLITSKEGRKYMESGRLKAYDSLKNSLTYKTAIEAINKATL